MICTRSLCATRARAFVCSGIKGAYLLRTNLQAGTAEELWSQYMQLTEAEASFRVLKSELSIRPLFHQKEPRVKAHVMVAFLGYALWVTLKRRSAMVPQPATSGVNNAQPLSAMKSLALLSTLQSADMSCPPPTAASFVSAASPNPLPSRNRFCNSSA